MKLYLYKAVGTGCIILFWLILHIYNQTLIPSPVAVSEAFARVLLDKSMYSDLYHTVSRVVLTSIYAVLIGVPIGICIGSVKTIYMSTSSTIDFLRSIPATAVFPIFLTLYGAGDESKIAAATFATILVVVFNVTQGVRLVSESKIKVLRGMGANWHQMLSKMLFWESLPHIFIGIRNGLSVAMVVIVVTEMFVGTNYGLGRKIIDSQITYNLDDMYAVIILVGLVGYFINLAVSVVENRVVHWKR